MKRWLIFLALGCSVFLVYFFLIGCDFQYGWDDQWMVMNNYTINGFTWANLAAVFTDNPGGQYSPINELIYMLIHALFGYNPKCFHLYTILLHVLNTCLVFVLIANLTKNLTMHGKSQWTAFATALVFAIHPLQVESIAWISASKIPLYTMFVLLAMLAYIRSVRSQQIRWYIAAFFLFVCACGSKEQAIMFPATLLLLDWLLGRSPLSPVKKIEKSTQQTKDRTWGYLLLEKLPFITIAAFGAGLTYFHQGQGSANIAYSLVQRFVFTNYSIVEYIGKIIAPINLLYLYPFPMAPGLPLPGRFFIYPAILLGGVGLLLYWLRNGNWRKHWPLVFGLLFFFINIALTLHIISMPRLSIIADRYVYLASVGLFFIFAWYGVPWLQQMLAAGRKWITVVSAVYVLSLGTYAHYRTYAWRNSETLHKELQELINSKDLQQQHEKGTKQEDKSK